MFVKASFYLVISLIFLFILDVVSLFSRVPCLKLKSSRLHDTQYEFVPYIKDDMPHTLVVDCSHPSCEQITHHLKKKNQKLLNDNDNRGDSATEGVLKAIINKSPYISHNQFVTCNHFDIDGFLSVWCILNQDLAKQHEHILRETAKIGDFRELSLSYDWQHKALRLACWLNSEERRLFYRAYEGRTKRKGGNVTETNHDSHMIASTTANINTQMTTSSSSSTTTITTNGNILSPDITKTTSSSSSSSSLDEYTKWDYFLDHFKDALLNISQDIQYCDPIYIEQSEKEYQQVVTGYHRLNSPDNSTTTVQRYSNLSLVVIRTPEPLHYYSLFSVSHGLDIVLSMYSNNRYELETKYTSHIDLVSRPVLPRADLQFLAVYLNQVEQELYHQHMVTNGGSRGSNSSQSNNNNDSHDNSSHSHDISIDDGKSEVYEWRADKPYDSGPILRLETTSYHLTKAERYGHPDERPIYSSLIPPDRFQAIILSYYTFVYEGVQPRKDWETAEIIEFNRQLENRLHEWKPEC